MGTLIQKGHENLIKLFNLSKQDLDFIGKIYSLEDKKEVSKIILNSKNLTHCSVYLSNIDRDDIIELLSSVGFDYPDYEKNMIYGYYFMFNNRVIF